MIARIHELLRSLGVEVVHDVTAFEPPSLSSAYTRSLEMLEKRQAAGERYDLYIDLHRDAYAESQTGPNTVNAGGVATSGLEMTQNAQKLNWTAEEVDAKLHQIMSSIHHACLEYGTEKDGYINYMKGANIAGFMKVAKSMVEQGVL